CGASSIGQDRQLGAAWTRLFAEDLRHVKQIRNAADAQDAGTPKRCLENVVAARQGARMRGCRFRRCIGSSRLQHDDWLGKGYLARSRQKCPSIYDRFHINQDALRAGVVPEVIDQSPPSNIEHRTGGHECAEAYLSTRAPVQNGSLQRATLT